MPLHYLPILTSNPGPRGPRPLIPPTTMAWTPVTAPLSELRVAILSSGAMRPPDQPAYEGPHDIGYRTVRQDVPAGDLITDHRSTAGTDARKDWEIVFPRAALAALAAEGVVGGVTDQHFTFMGGVGRQSEVEEVLGPALVEDLRRLDAGLALLVPY